MTVAYIGVVAGVLWQLTLPLNFGLLENFLFCHKIVIQNCKFGAENPSIKEKYGGRMKILSTYNLLLQITSCLSGNCNYLPHLLFETHDAADKHVTKDCE